MDNLDLELKLKKEHFKEIQVDFEDLLPEIKDKLQGDISAGNSILIYWKEYDEPDVGYLFSLPENDYWDEYDLYYHVPRPNVFGGKDEPEHVFGYLPALLCNRSVKSILGYSNKGVPSAPSHLANVLQDIEKEIQSFIDATDNEMLIKGLREAKLIVNRHNKA